MLQIAGEDPATDCRKIGHINVISHPSKPKLKPTKSPRQGRIFPLSGDPYFTHIFSCSDLLKNRIVSHYTVAVLLHVTTALLFAAKFVWAAIVLKTHKLLLSNCNSSNAQTLFPWSIMIITPWTEFNWSWMFYIIYCFLAYDDSNVRWVSVVMLISSHIQESNLFSICCGGHRCQLLA